jgi:hypothetical protein
MVTPKGFEQRVYVAASVADPNAPTVAEITAATEISGDLPAPVNFSSTTNFIDTSPLQQQDTNEIGTFGIDNSAFEIYRRKTGAIAYPALDDNTDYYLIKFEGGSIAGSDPAAADVCDVATITIGQKVDVPGPRNDTRRMNVPFAIRTAIARDSVVAA